MSANLSERFTLGRVHFARHDRGAGLIFWQHQFAQTTTGAGAQKSNVIGNFEKGSRHRL